MLQQNLLELIAEDGTTGSGADGGRYGGGEGGRLQLLVLLHSGALGEEAHSCYSRPGMYLQGLNSVYGPNRLIP